MYKLKQEKKKLSEVFLPLEKKRWIFLLSPTEIQGSCFFFLQQWWCMHNARAAAPAWVPTCLRACRGEHIELHSQQQCGSINQLTRQTESVHRWAAGAQRGSTLPRLPDGPTAAGAQEQSYTAYDTVDQWSYIHATVHSTSVFFRKDIQIKKVVRF